MKVVSWKSKTLVATAVTTVLSLSAGWAQADPLSLRLSQTVTHDTNLFRNDDDKHSDWISSTGVGLQFHKPYGRQTYRASADVTHHNYQDNSLFNNTSARGRLGFDTEIGSDFRLSLDGSADQSLPKFEDQYDRTVTNTKTYQSAAVNLRYGLHGRMSVNAGVNYQQLRFKEFKYEEKTTRGAQLGLSYYPSDLLAFTVSLQSANIDVPNRRVGPASKGDEIDRHSLNFGTVWQVTGLSQLRADIAWTDEKHPEDSSRNYSGLTGSASWRYTPAGKLSYSVEWLRDTNNAGGSSGTFFGNPYYQTYNRLTDSISLGAAWQATAKLAVNAGYRHTIYEEERDYQFTGPGAPGGPFSDNSTGRFNGWNLGVGFQIMPSLGLNCSVQTYDRTASIFAREYSGETYSCGASFTLDRLL